MSPSGLSGADATVYSGDVVARATTRAAIVSGLVAACAAIAGTLIGGALSRGQAHDQFIDERRQETFAQYLADVDALVTLHSAFSEDDSSVEDAASLLAGLNKVELDVNQIRLIAGQGIQDEARALADDLDGVVMWQLHGYCEAAGSTPSFCGSVNEGNASAMHDYDDDKEALMVSMRSEIDVPA